MTTKAKRTKPVIDEETKGDVIIRKDANGNETETITIKGAKIKQDETENDTEIFDNESENRFSNDSEFNLFENEEIPKTKIDTFFDDIREALQNENDSFFIKLIRTSDGMDDQFYKSHNGEDMIIGRFVCYLKDEFKIIETIQRKNNNSGGRMNMLAYDKTNQLLEYYVNSYFDKELKREMPITKKVIARDVYIPNPILEEKPQQQNTNDDKFMQMMQQNQNNFNQLITSLNKPKEDDTQKLIMAALIPVMIQKTINPETSNNANNPNMLTEIIKNELFQLKAITQMFPDAPKTPEPDFVDKAQKILDIPIIANLVDAVTNVGETILTSKFTAGINNIPNNQTQGTNEQTQNPQLETANDMEKLIEIIVNELDSENAIDKDNSTIQLLENDYPSQFDIVKTFCQTMPFESVFSMLINLTGKMPVSPFLQFLEIEQMQAAKSNAPIWNERGVRLQNRLLEVYNLVREN